MYFGFINTKKKAARDGNKKTVWRGVSSAQKEAGKEESSEQAQESASEEESSEQAQESASEEESSEQAQESASEEESAS